MHSIELKFAKFQFRSAKKNRRRLWLKIAKLIGNGVPIIQAIDTLYSRRMKQGQKKHHTTLALSAWSKALNNGLRFSDSIRDWVDDDEIMLVLAGEQAGEMERALLSVAEIMEARARIKGAVIGGTSYPVFLILIAFGGMALFGFNVIPAFTEMVPGDPWHGMARAVVDFSGFIQRYMILIICLFILGLVLFMFSLPRWTNRAGGLRRKLDMYAPYSIYRVIQGSTWLISFAAMIEAGMRAEDALEHLKRNSPPWLAARIQACLRGMRSGLGIGDALIKSGYNFPDPEIIDDMSVYSSLSGFDEALKILGREWLEEAVTQIATKMRIVFVFGIVFVGVVIIFFLSGLFALQLQLADAMRFL